MFGRITILAALGMALVGCGTYAPESEIGGEEISTAAEQLSTTECHVGQNGDDGYCTEACPCTIEEGDCNGSAECLPGLKCTFNVGADFGFDAGTDVCLCPGADRLGSSSYCSDLCPCNEGEGDCDSDSECGGGLSCYDDAGLYFGLDEETDVCTDCLPASANGHDDFCSADCPCDEGKGDCDSDSDCAAGLSCFNNVGADFGMDPGTDVCAACPPDSLNGSGEFCTPGCPCSHGQGDCDEDADCETGATCVHNVGAQFGLDADTDVCVVL